MRTKTMIGAACLALCAAMSPVSAIAQEALTDPDSTAQGDVAITIYNGGDSLVQDVRQLAIGQGRITVPFPDVSSQIQPETLSFSAPDTAIVEQNFDFDLLTPTKLMEKAVGQEVTLIRTNPATGAETRERATVLSVQGGVVIRIGDRIEVLRDDGLPVRVIFDRVPPNLRARPTLSVTLESSRAGTRPAALRYLTAGLGWSADYVALFDEGRGTIDVQGWVTLTNRTGTTFHDADVLLVAGNPGGGSGAQVRRVSRGSLPPPPPPGTVVNPGTETADRERLGDYYLYPIEGRTTVADAQTKQVGFLDVQGVPAQRRYRREIGWLQSDERPVSVTSAIAFTSSRDGGLGDALPAGTMRFYQRDARGTPQFIGENRVGHTPMGSTLFLPTGDAFDVNMQAEIESRDTISAGEWQRSARYRVVEDSQVVREVEVDRPVEYFRTTMRYTFTNARPDAVDVELVQNGLYPGWWGRDYRIVSEDIEGEQVNADTRRWTVRVPANGERVVRVTYETRY